MVIIEWMKIAPRSVADDDVVENKQIITNLL